MKARNSLVVWCREKKNNRRWWKCIFWSSCQKFFVNIKRLFMVDLLSNRLHEKLMICYVITQPANIRPREFPRTSPSNVPKKSPKDPFDRHGDVPIWRPGQRPNLTSRGCPEMTSKGCIYLTFKGRLWEVDSGCPRMFSRRPLEDLQSTQTCMSQHFFKLFFQNLFDWPNLSNRISFIC